MLIVLDEELDILRGMQPLDRDVFNYLAARVDFDTGLVGSASYGGIALDLSERNSSGRSVDSVQKLDRHKVRNSVKRLVSVGLLRSFSEQGKDQDLILLRVFWARLLDTDRSVQNEVTRRLRASYSQTIGKLSCLINHIERHQDDEKRAGYAEVAITLNNIHTYTDAEFSMSVNWQPTLDELEVMLIRSGYSMDQVDPVWITKFVGYWSLEKNQGRKYSQGGWTHKLLLELIDNLRHPGLYEQRRGIVNKPGQARTSGQQKTSGLPEWAVPPKEDHMLNGWMRKHGYGDGPPGFAFYQMRQWLQSAIEGRLKDWRKLS
jgi:hypothetical protein